MRVASLALLLVAAPALVVADDHAEHDHEFEWGGIFALEESLHYWNAEKVDGAYADEHMNIYLYPTADDSEEYLEEAEEALEDLPFENCTAVYAANTGMGTVMVPNASLCYELHFNDKAFLSIFPINTSSTAGLAIFTEHYPLEFEENIHFFKTAAGEDVEASHEYDEEEGDDEDKKKWSTVILACVIVNLLTLTGVALLGIKIAALETFFKMNSLLHSFAAGALLSTVVYLMLPEAMHFFESKHSGETAVAWRYGSCILAGFLFPILASFIPLPTCLLSPPHEEATSLAQEGKDAYADQKGVELADPKGGLSKNGNGAESDRARQQTLEAHYALVARSTSAVLVGDFLHNVTDGFIIAIAFQFCSGSFAWSITGGVIAHELAQEVSDFIILTTSPINMPVAKALALNFLSGTSVIVGGLIGTAIDIGSTAFAVLLAIGAGVYIYVATAVALSTALSESAALGKWGVVHVFIGFLVGAIAIGLVLLDHEHCESEEGGGGHAH